MSNSSFIKFGSTRYEYDFDKTDNTLSIPVLSIDKLKFESKRSATKYAYKILSKYHHRVDRVYQGFDYKIKLINKQYWLKIPKLKYFKSGIKDIKEAEKTAKQILQKNSEEEENV